jgi:hypothetical protein
MSTPERVALIIGMDEFQSPDLVRLDSCRKDAQDMFERLSNLSYAIYGNSPMIGSNLDKKYGWTQFRESVVKFFDSTLPEQTVLFYYSGHGIALENDIFEYSTDRA